MRDVVNARSFNTILGILILVQVLFLILIVSLLIAPIISADLHILSTISIAFMFLVCLPLSLYLFLKSADQSPKLLFFSLFFFYFMLALSTLLWFILPQIVDNPWLIKAGKAVMLFAYIPILLTFIQMTKEKRKEVWPNVNYFIIFINVVSALAIVLFTTMNITQAGSDAFSATIYALSIVFDIAILSMGAILALNSMENQLRYLLAVPLSTFLFSLAGDSLMLLEFLGLYATLAYAQFFFDGMLIFGGLALLFIALGNIKVTTVEEVNRELSDVRNRMYDLVMQSPVAICIFDVGGTAVLANKAFIQFAGKRHDDVIGRFNIFRDAEEYIKGSGEKMAEIQRGDVQIYEGITQAAKPGIKGRYYSVKVFPTLDAEYKVSSYIAMLLDVTESKTNEERLRAAKNEAELYLDLMSHDINNMDQIALGFLEMVLERPGLDPVTKEMISHPIDALESSTHLIRNVQKLQKIRGNGHKLQPTDVRTALQDAAREYANIPGREVRIVEELDGDSTVQANGLLTDVFSNIIGNAIKHSDGPITITVKMDKVEENGRGQCRVRIEDDGPGIPDENKALIFNRFQKGSARASGKGLGLYLVKTLVDCFHGSVMVEDRIAGDSGKGSRFVVLLPALEP